MQFRAVSADNWQDFESLFECRGGPHYCWCMAWRRLESGLDKTGYASGKAARKRSIHSLIEANVPVGILAYRDQTPIGWCSVAPRGSHRPLGGCDGVGVGENDVWSITCFFVLRAHRRSGLSTALLKHAVDYAVLQGARHIEAYPVRSDSPSYGFMGRVSTFESAGFAFQHMAGKRRHVMLLSV